MKEKNILDWYESSTRFKKHVWKAESVLDTDGYNSEYIIHPKEKEYLGVDTTDIYYLITATSKDLKQCIYKAEKRNSPNEYWALKDAKRMCEFVEECIINELIKNLIKVLKTLNKPYSTLAIKQIDKDYFVRTFLNQTDRSFNLKNAVLCFSKWYKTNEGVNYWKSVYNNI